MKDLKNEIKTLISGAENAEVEFKSAKGGLPESFWESFSAFANTNGGIIVLGVKEKNGKFISDGLTNEQIATYKKRFWDCAHNKEKVSATMLTESDVLVGEIDGSQYLAFRIPRAAYNIRPVYLTRNPFGNTYKRNHEGDYHCTDAEVREMFADAQHATAPFDNQILPNYNIDDLDAATLKEYRQRFLLKRDNHPWNGLDDMSFLTKIGAYRVDRKTGNEGFTRAGILMFGKTESITDNACTPWYFVDYQEKLSDTPGIRWSNRIYPDGTWEANIFQFFYRVSNQISHTIPTPFMLNGITRIEETPAHIAIREGLVNMLVHSSYAEQGNIVVLRERGSIIMRNPGRMLISVDDFYAGSHSLCRNPNLQKMFMLVGYGEKAGSGADYIVKGWEKNSLARPKIEETVQPDTVTLTFELEDEKPKENNDSKDSERKLSQDDSDLSQVVLSLSQVCPKLKKYSSDKISEFINTLREQPQPMLKLMEVFGEKNRTRFRNQIIIPLINSGYIESTVKEIPNSPKQLYRVCGTTNPQNMQL
ncbi:MAG: putative DNA binding domain-containing protein [Prevotella sp.]|nr:putative DNA binding domain-containing protein [Prevotella sp.]